MSPEKPFEDGNWENFPVRDFESLTPPNESVPHAAPEDVAIVHDNIFMYETQVNLDELEELPVHNYHGPRPAEDVKAFMGCFFADSRTGEICSISQEGLEEVDEEQVADLVAVKYIVMAIAARQIDETRKLYPFSVMFIDPEESLPNDENKPAELLSKKAKLNLAVTRLFINQHFDMR